MAVWLYLPRLDLFSDRARALLEAREPVISPMALLELEHLREVGRLRASSAEILESLHIQLGLRVLDLEFGRVIHSALAQTWTRDPFDRLIVGHAAAARGELLTRDEVIHAHFRGAAW